MALLCCCFLFFSLGCEKSGGTKTIEFPVLGNAPDFTLTDTKGEPFSLKDGAGKVRVVSFFFSRCPSICPRINRQLAEIVRSTESQKDFLFLSISVDPEFDTPEILSEYAKEYRSDSERWKFLTGDKQIIEGLLRTGFKLSSGMLPDQHNTRVVVVDREGQIRAFYQGMDSAQLKQLQVDLASFYR